MIYVIKDACIHFFHYGTKSRMQLNQPTRRGQDKFPGPRKWGLAERLTKTDRDAKRSTIRERSANEASTVGNVPKRARCAVRVIALYPRSLPLPSAPLRDRRKRISRGAISRCNHLAGWICIIQRAALRRRARESPASWKQVQRTNEREPGVGPRHRGPLRLASGTTSRTKRERARLATPRWSPRRAPFSIPRIASIARIRCETACLG